MEPMLRAGDVVLVGTCDPEKIQVGDIILFDSSGKSVLHRVIQIEYSSEVLDFTTQGDANNVSDTPVTVQQVRGKAILKIPKIGWLSLYLKRVIGWLV